MQTAYAVERDSPKNATAHSARFPGVAVYCTRREGRVRERSFAQYDRRHRLHLLGLGVAETGRKAITWINTLTTTRVTSWNTGSRQSRGLPGGSIRHPTTDRINRRLSRGAHSPPQLSAETMAACPTKLAGREPVGAGFGVCHLSASPRRMRDGCNEQVIERRFKSSRCAGQLRH
jgi:hypothetical protein